MKSFINKNKYLVLSVFFLALFFVLFIQQRDENIDYDILSPEQEEKSSILAEERFINEEKEKKAKIDVIDESVTDTRGIHDSKVKRISILEKDIDQEVIPVGVDDEGRVETLDNAHDLTWYARTGKNIKNIIIAGHRDWANESGYQVGKLFQSESWDKGLELKIEFENGKTEIFELTHKYNYKPDETPSEIMNTEEGDYRVTLMTCVGEYKQGYGYEERIYNVFSYTDR